MTKEETAAIRQWQYDDVDEEPAVGLPGHDDFTAISGDEVVGYCSFGKRAMVPHYLDEEHFVGVAWGVRPAIVGGGHGRKFLEAIVTRGSERYQPRRLQAVIKQSNPRSLRAAKKAGFLLVGEAGDRFVLQMPH